MKRLVEQLAKLTGADAQLLVAASKVVGAIGSAISGGDAQFADDLAGFDTAYNRQLHEDDRERAKKLAAKSGGIYTVEEIENAMRNSGNTDLGESVSTGMVVTKDNPVYDDGAQFMAGHGNTAVQILPNGGKVDAQLAAYILANTGGSNSPYSWTSVQLGVMAPVVTNPNAGLNQITPAGNGCVTAECVAGTTPVRSPIRDSQDIRKDVVQGAAVTSRLAGIVSSTATAAAVVPGLHQPGAAAIAAGATAVDFGAKVVEMIAVPDVGKGVVEVGVTWLGEKATGRAPLAAPLINEIMEKIKNSPEAHRGQNLINDTARGEK